MPNLTSQMEAVCRRFEELSVRLNQPETAADPAQFRRLMQEYHEAQPVVDAYHALTTAQDHLAQAKALLEGDEPLDADFKAMVQQELSEKSQDVAELENNLKILLLPKDVNDEKSVIMEIRAGAGGEEAALFAHSLVRMYTMYVQSRGWEMELLNLNETELGGTKEALCGQWPGRLQPPQVRERCPPGAACTGNGDAGPHPYFDGHRGRDAAGRRG